MDRDGWDISRGPHRPLHWYADQSCYWITGATLHHAPHFRSSERKDQFVAEMLASAETWGAELVGWTVMEHHYHALLRLQQGRALPRLIGRMHTRTATLVNREDRTPGRQVWRQYWDTLVHTEGDFWCRINYIWWNPVRHGFCASPEEWQWTNLTPLLQEPDASIHASLARFPAPRRFPGRVI
jgi:putative transposase